MARPSVADGLRDIRAVAIAEWTAGDDGAFGRRGSGEKLTNTRERSLEMAIRLIDDVIESAATPHKGPDPRGNRLFRSGYCMGPLDGRPPPGSVGVDDRAACCTCGKRVKVTVRCLYANHKPAKDG